MPRNLDGRIERLERARGIRRNVNEVREMTREELTDALIECGVPIHRGMSSDESMPILKAELAKVEAEIAEEERTRAQGEGIAS